MTSAIHVALFRYHLPVVVALGTEAFAERDLLPRFTVVRSSTEQRELIETAAADLAHTAVDNVAAWHTAERPWTVLRVVDLGIPHQLVTRPECGTLADLRDRRVAVDSARSGFVTLLRSVLAAEGLAGSVEFVEVGALQRRLDALREGIVDACLLGAEQLAAALAGGARVLGALNTFFPGYPGLTVAGLASRLGESGDVVTRYLGVLDACASWCFDEGRAGEVIELVSRVMELDPGTAAAWYRAEAARRTGAVKAGAGERRTLERAWRATGRVAPDQPIPTGWFTPWHHALRDPECWEAGPLER